MLLYSWQIAELSPQETMRRTKWYQNLATRCIPSDGMSFSRKGYRKLILGFWHCSLTASKWKWSSKWKSTYSVKEMPSSLSKRCFTDSLDNITLTLANLPTSLRNAKKSISSNQSCTGWPVMLSMTQKSAASLECTCGVWMASSEEPAQYIGSASYCECS